MIHRGHVALLFAVALASAPLRASATQLTTDQPLDGLEQCFRAQWAGTGKITSINTAGGVLLDLAFDSVGADAKVATGHLAFTVEDQGTQRTVSAAAANPADEALANQLLGQAAKKCLPDATGQKPGTPPPSLIAKKPER